MKVSIVMGSKSDLDLAKAAEKFSNARRSIHNKYSECA